MKESKENGYEDDLFPILAVSHFLITDKEASFLYAKEVVLRKSRAPPEYWRNHSQSERFLHINDERAAHHARCAALFVFSQLREKGLTT